MFEVMDAKPFEVLSGYLVPFRSREWNKLSEKSASILFGIGLWREVFERAKVQTVIAFGKEVGPHLISILSATLQDRHPSGWGTLSIEQHRFGRNGRLVVLPHLSRFGLFGRPTSEAAFRAALA